MVQFLNTDYGLVNSSPQDRATIQSKQTQLAQKPVQDPRVSGAMSVLRTAFPTALDAMGIRETADDKANPDSPLVHFTGALQGVWRRVCDHGGKPPDYEAITGPIFKQPTAKQTPHMGTFGTVRIIPSSNSRSPFPLRSLSRMWTK